MKAFAFEESWEVIRQVLPADLEALARQSGSFQRARKVGDAQTLLRLLLMHAGGLSLQRTALRAQAQGLSRLSAVALFKRLRRCGTFLQQLAGRVLAQVQPQGPAPARWPEGYRFRLIDATTVTEPGPKGRCWRLHYSLRLPELDCDHFELTDLKAGESFKRWQAAANEVLLADRAYARCEAVGALLAQGAKVVVRCNGRSFPLWTEQGERFNLRARSYAGSKWARPKNGGSGSGRATKAGRFGSAPCAKAAWRPNGPNARRAAKPRPTNAKSRPKPWS